MIALLTATIAPIFLVVAASMLAGRFLDLRTDTLSRSTIYLFSPALILSSIIHSDMAVREVGGLLVAAVVLSLLLAAVAGGMVRVAGFERALGSSFMLTVFIMNAGNFGLPFVEFSLGQRALARAVVFATGTGLTIHTLGVYVASRGRSSVGQSVRNVVTTPLPYAVLLGLGLNATGSSLPGTVDRAVTLLGQAAIPTQLVLLGLQLREVFGRTSGLWADWRPVLFATVARFGLGVALGAGLSALFGFQSITRQVFILQAAMPCGVMSGVLSETFGGDPEFAAATILASMVVGVAVLGGLLAVLL